MSATGMAGDVIDGALTASVVDGRRSATEETDGHTHETACLNCGTQLTGAFCHACGQGAHVHRTLGAFFHDLLHGAFHFEGRVFHTLPLLVVRPGALTRRYIDGQRARFVSPLALFLFCVFVMYATIQQTSHHDGVSAHDFDGKVVESQAAINSRLAELTRQRSMLVARHADTEDVDDEIASLQPVRAAIQAGDKQKGGSVSVQTGITAIDAMVARARENPALALYKVETHAYKFSWLLIPISAPLVWLLFPFSRRFALYDHTVFVTYSLCFMTLLAVVAIVSEAVGSGLGGVLMVFAPPLHMYRQLRGTYGCSRLGAIARTAALLVFAVLALVVFTLLIVAQSAD
ncbi:DUF3667 domain-containing protein [Novosphingobium sp.]|uniref:DUF3667 domain-containing protein n=1 Tax=Novosphingobium sp. TaxID=1874826 RepID=UPI00333FA940